MFVNYNLGSKDITFGDLMTKVNDGRYHTVRFVRSDINATIQVDDRPVQTKFPQGNKHYSKTTVFNEFSNKTTVVKQNYGFLSDLHEK